MHSTDMHTYINNSGWMLLELKDYELHYTVVTTLIMYVATWLYNIGS